MSSTDHEDVTSVTSRVPFSAARQIFAAALLALVLSWLLTHSEAVQFLVLIAIFAVGRLLMDRRIDGRDDALDGLSMPWRLGLLSLTLVLPVGVAVFFLSGWIDLGLVWFMVLLWVYAEISEGLAKRDLERHGTASWGRARPLRESAIAGAITVPAIAAIALVDGAGLLEAGLAGIACGVVVLGLGLCAAWLDRRSRSTG